MSSVWQVRSLVRHTDLCSHQLRLEGFSYDFNSLGDTQDGNELRQAFKTLLNVESRPPIFQMIQSLVPVLRIIVSEAISLRGVFEY